MQAGENVELMVNNYGFVYKLGTKSFKFQRIISVGFGVLASDVG